EAAVQARVADGRLRFAEGDLAGAIERFETVLREDGSHAEAQRALGEAQGRRATLEAREKEAARHAALDAQVAEGRLRRSQGGTIGALQQLGGGVSGEGGGR